jgi:prepilin-type N-terminal cleavage/methylation domain-containing protein
VKVKDMIKSLKKQQGGFTLIELMVVIVIIGILVAIALPNFIGAQDRAKVASVKANMHTFQTALETYAVDWGGQYPTNVVNAKSQATTDGYWKDFINPIDKAVTSLTDYNATVATTDAGTVQYNPSAPVGTSITRYFVYGADKVGVKIKDKGTPFTLSNS